MKYVLVDIDHTLSAAAWRDHLIPNDSKDYRAWDIYHKDCGQDALQEDVASIILSMYYDHWNVIAMTARPLKWREETIKWLERHFLPIRDVMMRPDNNYEPTAQLKVQMFKERFPNITNHRFIIIEDRLDVADAFAALGITVLQVHVRKEYK